MVKKAFYAIDIPLYAPNLVVSIGQSNQEFKKSMMQHYGLTEDSFHQQCRTGFDIGRNTLGICIQHDNGNVLIRVRSGTDTPDGMDTLMHEVFHAVLCILDWGGMKVTNDSEEAYAYMQGYITLELFKRFLKKRQTKHKSLPDPMQEPIA